MAAYPFPFGFFPRRAIGVPRLDRGGIYKLCTTGVAVSADSTTVDFGIDACQFNQLPNEGYISLHIRHTVPAAGANLPVTVVATHRSPIPAIPGALNGGNRSQLPVVDHANTPVTGANVVNPSERFAYYNKCCNILRFVEFTNPAAPAPASEEVVKPVASK